MNAKSPGAIPFVILLLPYLIGIATGINLAALTVTTCFTILFALTIVFILVNLFYTSLHIYNIRWVGGILMAAILIAAGITTIVLDKEINNQDHFSKHKADHLVIKIAEEPVWKNGTLRFTANVEKAQYKNQLTDITGKLLVSIKDTLAVNLLYGDVLLIPAKYNMVDPPFNPAEFNYKKYLANKNIYHQAYLYPGQYVPLKSGEGNSVIAYALQLRKSLVAKLCANITNPAAAAVASTLILGYKAELSNDILQAYSKTGTIHVLSVSGAHVALIYVVLLFALSFLSRYKHGRVIQAIIIIMLIWCYALLTGFSPPVCRAAVMLSLIIAGKVYSRYISTLNILAFSAFVMLLFDPMLITDVGFQLSYLAVAGLIILQPLIYKRIIFKNKWVDKLWLVCTASIAAQIATLPLSAYYFHQVPVYFLISNLLILLPSAIIMYGGILYLFMPEDFLLTKWLGVLLEKLILVTNNGLTIIEYAPLSVINKVWLSSTEYLLLYAIIAMFFIFIYNRKRGLLYTVLCLTAVFIILQVNKKRSLSQSVQIAFMSLRKDNGIIFRNGNDAVVVTDLSNRSKAFQYSLQPYLDSTGVNTVTVVGLKEGFKNGYLSKRGNNIRFMHRNIYVIEKATISYPTADVYYIASNNKTIANELIHTKLVVVGAEVNRSYTAAIVIQAKALNMPCKILRRNKAFIITSKGKNN